MNPENFEIIYWISAKKIKKKIEQFFPALAGLLVSKSFKKRSENRQFDFSEGHYLLC